MRRLVIALTAFLFAAGLVVVGGYLFVFGAVADRAARLAPADTTAYVTVYLNPSTGQRMNLSDILVCPASAIGRRSVPTSTSWSRSSSYVPGLTIGPTLSRGSATRWRWRLGPSRPLAGSQGLPAML
jgi:hypothetical protein